MLSSAIQLEIENITPQIRRVYVSSGPLPLESPAAVPADAWRYWTLKSGARGYATYQPTYQLTAQIIDEGVDHRTVMVETGFGAQWTFEIAAAGPQLTPAVGGG